jgi:hypothetical protein
MGDELDTQVKRELPPDAGSRSEAPVAPSANQRLEVGLREDQLELLARSLAPARPRLLSSDSVLKMVQTLAILAAIGWPMHDYFAYKRVAKNLELSNLEHDEQLKGLAVQSATSLQFTRRASTEVIDIPGSDQNGTHLYRVKIGVQVTNNSQLYLESHGVRLRLLLGSLRDPAGTEYAIRTNGPGHRKGGIIWRLLLDSGYHGHEQVKDWNPQKLGLDIPTGVQFEDFEGGFAFGQLAPTESAIGVDEFRIRAPKDSYVGFVLDYILKSYTVEQLNGSPSIRNEAWEQQEVELVRHLTELGLHDEWGRSMEAARTASAGGSPVPPHEWPLPRTAPQAHTGSTSGAD